METFQSLLMGLSVATDPMNLLFCLIGILAGSFIGVLPGLGPSAGIAILLPITFGIEPTAGIILLAGIYYGAMYGGSITSILIGVPGDPSSVVTMFDGYPLAQQGRGGPAMGMSAFASFIGGTVCVIIFTFLAPALAKVALSFGPPEYFALMVLGLTAVSGLADKSALKAFLSTLIGLFISIMGLDLVTGLPRFTFGQMNLFDGIDFVIVALGVFGISEILISMEEEAIPFTYDKEQTRFRNLFPTLQDWAVSIKHIFSSTIVGFFIGMLPGAGATVSTFITYGIAKNTSKPERKKLFGKGAIEGVAAPECANNAASVGAFVPLLTLGVPGSASTAVMMGALMMFGLRPGPTLFEKNPDFVWGLIGSMYIGNLLLVILTLLLVPVFVRMLKIPPAILNAIVMAFILVGAYSISSSMFDVGVTIFFGLLGYVMKKMDYPVAPLVLALVLGNMLETSLRQSLIISNGGLGIFFTRPISCVMLIIACITVVWPLLKARFQRQKVN
ncbi:MAG TPA: tripartite tricarboxylate transporter permease [Verrucomicrobiae bacterium]|nr:tripartite tricarboxylate transporter permease [Verrucomicrobiae bacterium]